LFWRRHYLAPSGRARMGSRVFGALLVHRPSRPLFCAWPAPLEAVSPVAADGRPDALFDPSPALAGGGVAPTAEYVAARVALRARPPVVPGPRRSAPGGAVETAPLPHRHRRPPGGRQPGAQPGRRGGRRDARLRSADGHGWAWSELARSGNGPRAVGRVPSPLRIARAIPPGYRRAGQAHRWLARVREAALSEFRADAAERRIALATVAARHLDVTTGTYAGGWSRLASLVGCSRSTVARWLGWLRARSLLGVVSTGRPADLTAPMPLAGGLAAGPAGRPAGPGWHGGGLRGPDGRPVNEAAVYVPCEPDTPRAGRDPDPGLLVLDPRWHTGQLTVGPDGRAVDRSRHPRAVDEPPPPLPLSTAQPTPLSTARGAGAGQAVDRTDTPMWSSEAGTQPGRAHATTCTHHPARAQRPLRGRNIAAPRQHPPRPPDPNRPGTVGSPGSPTATAAATEGAAPEAAQPGWCPECGPWPATQPATTRTERLRLAHQLRRVSPDLHPLSPRLLRHLLRPWLLAGWTLTDVLHAIDHHPTHGPRHHSPTGTGPGTIRNPPGWLLHRLHDWQHPDGTPMPSHRQRTATTRAAGRYTPPPTGNTGNTGNSGNSADGTTPTRPITWPPVRHPPDPHTP